MLVGDSLSSIYSFVFDKIGRTAFLLLRVLQMPKLNWDICKVFDKICRKQLIYQ
jgi:hypothetical protein